MNYGEEVKARRKQLGISQLDLSEFAEISLATVKDVERGQANPSLATMEKINLVLGLELVLQVKKVF